MPENATLEPPATQQTVPPVTPGVTTPPVTEPTAPEPVSADKLKELGINQVQYDSLAKAGMIQSATAIGDLPQALQDDIQAKIRDAQKEGSQIARDQLHKTLEKQRTDMDSLKGTIEEREAKIKAEEDASKASVEAELEKTRSIEEKLENMRLESQKAIESISNTATTQMKALENQLNVERLRNMRQELLATANGELIPELLSDPSLPGLTPELLTASFETAKATYASMKEKMVTEYQTANPVAPDPDPAAPATGQSAPFGGRGMVPPQNSHLGSTPDTFNADTIKNMGAEALASEKERLLKKFGYE